MGTAVSAWVSALGEKKRKSEKHRLHPEGRSCRLQQAQPCLLLASGKIFSHYSVGLDFQGQVAELVCMGSNPTFILVLVREIAAISSSVRELSLEF